MKYIMIGVDLGERRADGAIEALFSTSQVNPRVDDRRVLRWDYRHQSQWS